MIVFILKCLFLYVLIIYILIPLIIVIPDVFKKTYLFVFKKTKKITKNTIKSIIKYITTPNK